MVEKDFQKRFTRWAKAHIRESCAIELKLAKAPSLPFSALADHQVYNLQSASKRTLVYKLPDVGYDIKPFDQVILSGVKAYVGVMYYLNRGDNEFFLIPIDAFVRLRDTSTRKSMTKDEAMQIAEVIGRLES